MYNTSITTIDLILLFYCFNLKQLSTTDKVELYVDASFSNCKDYKKRTGVYIMFK